MVAASASGEGMGKALVKVKVLISEQAQPTRRNWRATWLTVGTLTGTLLGTIALVVSGGWLAVRLIVNPGSVNWLTWILPEWSRLPFTEQTAQTLAKIEAGAAQAGLFAGDPISLSSFYLSADNLDSGSPGASRLRKNLIGTNDFLLPIFAPLERCNSETVSRCQQMVELRVYRPQPDTVPGEAPTFELVDRMTITGPEELAAIAPLTNSTVASQGSTQKLPLTDVTPIAGHAPAAGVWFHLSGEWKRGSNRVIYGQVMHYDPMRGELQRLLSWTSPAAQIPQWQQVTDSTAPELVVNQTIGLEPQFQVYRVRVLNAPGQSMQLEAIALTEPALNQRSYENGLLLARNGLWSPALKLLQSAKQQGKWSDFAQAQMGLVALHAQVTQAQAERDWASPTQQIVAQLIDGRWSQALSLLKTAHQNGDDIPNLLVGNTDRLWQRVEAALRVDPNQLDIQRWGVLVLAVQQNRKAAIAWIQQQRSAHPTALPSPQVLSNSQLQKVLALLDPLPNASPTALPTVWPNTSPNASSTGTTPAIAQLSSTADSSRTLTQPTLLPVNPISRIIGAARPVAMINPADWSSPEPTTTLTLGPNQAWYQVQVIGFEAGQLSGQTWRRSPFADLNLAPNQSTTQIAQNLWNLLGLASNPQLQLINWTGTQSQIIQTTVKAVQLREGTLQLLAVGEAPPHIHSIASASTSDSASPDSLLAMTLHTLPWVEPTRTLTLSQLNQQPFWNKTLLPALLQELQRQELQQATTNLPAAITSPTRLLQAFGNSSVALIKLAGTNSPEALLTLQASALDSTTLPGTDRPSQTHTVILSSQGAVLYSDLQDGDPEAEETSFVGIVKLTDQGKLALIVRDAEGYQVRSWSTQSQRFE